MADGEGRDVNIELDIKPQSWWRRLLGYRDTPYLSAAFIVAAALTATVFAHTFSGVAFLNSLPAKLYFLAATAVLALPLVLLLRDSTDNLAHGPSPALPAVCVAILAIVAAALVGLQQLYPEALNQNGGLFPSVVTCLFAGLALAYLPLAWNAAAIQVFAHRERKALILAQRDRDNVPEIVDADQQDAEAVSALISTLAIAAITALAVAAGQWGESISLQEFFGIGLGLFVVSVFAVVIFIEPLSKFSAVRFLARQFQKLAVIGKPLANVYNGIDGLLVRIGAIVAGMEHRSMWSRYSVLGSQLALLCVLGWFMPAPLGLVPCILGVIIAISVSRLWSWVEDDRALALLTDFNPATPFRTKMREDYRDETLLGFIFVFVLMPIMMRQAHESSVFGRDMFSVPENRDGFLSWVGFFGIELAKAVPIVDWAEIYQIQAKDGAQLISMNSVASRHAVFLARATVDLVLIASLLQAIGISNRNRQQKQLFKAGTSPEHRYRPGLIDRLDKFVEESELIRAIQVCLKNRNAKPTAATTEQEAHEKHFDLKRLGEIGMVDFRRYNADRLLEIHGQSKDPTVRSFIAAIAYERPDLTLKSRLQLLEEFAEQGRNEIELYTVLQRLIADHNANPRSADIGPENLRAIMFSLKTRQGLKDLKQSVLDLMTRVGPKSEVIEYLADIAGRSDPDQFQYTRVHAVEKISGLARGDDVVTPAAISRLKEIIQSKPGARTERAAVDALEKLNSLI